MQYDDVTNA